MNKEANIRDREIRKFWTKFDRSTAYHSKEYNEEICKENWMNYQLMIEKYFPNIGILPFPK